MEMQKKLSGGGQSYFRAQNISLVVNTINKAEPITKRELVNRTGLSFAKVNSIIQTLNKNKFSIEAGKEGSDGGRPSTLYRINPKYRYIIGCELAHARVHTIVADLKSNIIYNKSIGFEKSSGKDFLIKTIVKSIQDARDKSKIPKKKMLGIGLAITGLVNQKEGTAHPFPHMVDWGEIPLKKIIEEKFHLLVFVDNLANSAALAELNWGERKGKKNLLFIDVGRGVGMGIILNGSLYAGSTGAAGEFGHITVDENGPICTCGNVGCIETLASTRAIEHRAKEMLKHGVMSTLREMSDGNVDKINFELICKASNNGDKLSFNLLDEMGKSLGEGIVTIINLFNPGSIILGGEINSNCKPVLDSITNVVQKRALEIPRRASEILYSSLGDNVFALGAIIPLIERFFSTCAEFFV